MKSEDFMELIQEVMSFNHAPDPNLKDVKEIFDDSSIETFSNEKLCSLIASNRYLK